MITCPEVMDLISSYIDDEVSEIEKKSVEQHLRDCPECRKEYEYTLEVLNALKEIRKIMWECGAIVRSEKRCADGFARITQIESTFNPIHHFEQRIDIRKISELVSSIQLAKILLGVMNERRESRGPHYRSDFPDQVSKFNGRVSVQKGSDCPVYRLMK